MIAGLTAEGVDVTTLGVVPTPAVAWLAVAEGAAGAVISASHNSFADNGVKLFTADGKKLSDEVEERLEKELLALLGGLEPGSARTGEAVGTIVDGSSAVDRWAESVAGSIQGRGLAGLTVVVDCANGAASVVAPRVLRSLGATVEVIHDQPDGTNINADCGSTYPDDLRRAVVTRGADVGLAFDGDADRVLAIDATGRLIDGDQIIGICAIDRHAPRSPGQGHRRRHRDDQPRVPAGDGGARRRGPGGARR